ncbi:hypothetical protein [Trinickia terrae]|uniref:hypothetical protein n=1 Tax=Trinickia terrae TaxID=2571161 RepID=UPI0010ADEA3A|nr:hypothetical protein [Trinickia terrae]
MSLLLCGVVVSLATVAAQAQHSPRDWGRQPNGTTPQSAPSRDDARSRQLNPTVPRGDLRGDIASNARMRADPSRNENRQQP